MNKKVTVTLGLLILLSALGTVDALLTTKPILVDTDALDIVVEQPDPVIQDTSPTPTPPVQGVRKQTGPNVLEVLTQQGYTFKETDELSVLGKIIPSERDAVQSRVLMKEKDRIGLIAWAESSEVKKDFIILKEALHISFSPQVQDLIDETQRREGHPTRNLLTFLDPALSQERIVFIRVRQRLYEFHISPDKDDMVFELIDVLTE